jgi:hypothetical protein
MLKMYENGKKRQEIIFLIFFIKTVWFIVAPGIFPGGMPPPGPGSAGMKFR